MTTGNYILKAHELFAKRIDKLKEQVQSLKKSLPAEKYREHEVVKFAARVRFATCKTIPENPDRPEYRLKGELRRYRRYKQGLQRYRLFFGFSKQPPIIIYLYLNNAKHLRKAGHKSDPYEQFKKIVRKKAISPDPLDPEIQKWIHEYR